MENNDKGVLMGDSADVRYSVKVDVDKEKQNLDSDFCAIPTIYIKQDPELNIKTEICSDEDGLEDLNDMEEEKIGKSTHCFLVEQTFTCYHCGLSCENLPDLEEHIKQRHLQELQEQSALEGCNHYMPLAKQYLNPHACSHCSFRTKYSHSLQLHVMTRHGRMESHCQYSFDCTTGVKRTLELRDDPQPSTSLATETVTRASFLKKKNTYITGEPGEVLSILEDESDDGLETDYDSGESVIGDTDEENEEITKDRLEPSSSETISPDEDRMILSSTQICIPTSHRQKQMMGQEPPFQWTPQQPLSPNLISFTLNPGLTDPPLDKQPIHYFKTIFNREIITKIVEETNNYAEVKKASVTGTYARMKRWKPLTVEEFTVWLGVLFHMGHVIVCRISDYWSTDILYNFPFFRTVMSRDRFLNILNCLYFHPYLPPKQQRTDRLHKIRPLIEYFHDIMEKVVTPTRRLCIDESMILWRGRLVFRVYLKGKRHKYGIKLYMLTESSGLVLRLILYSGLGEQEVSGQGHVDLVVKKLMEGKLDLGHSLFMDNYYNSVRLAHEFLERKTYVTGILRKNRKNNPPEVISKNLKQFETTSLYSDRGICVIKWKDRREVLMISSEYGPDLVDVTNRRGQTAQKPEMVAEYNKSMVGMDHMDQLMAYYPIERKCIKWYRKVAIHIFHLILANSYILYKKDNPSSKMSLYDYRVSIVKSLAPPTFSSSPSVSVRTSPERTVDLHAPQQRPLNEKNRRIMRRCVLCSKSGKRKESSYYCPSCPGEPNLCARSCFREFHAAL